LALIEEPLARRPADKDVETALPQTQASAHLSGVNIFNVVRFRPGLRVVERKRLNGFQHAVIGIEAPVSGLAKSFRDAARPAKEIDR
jgi:hypothetical protein